MKHRKSSIKYIPKQYKNDVQITERQFGRYIVQSWKDVLREFINPYTGRPREDNAYVREFSSPKYAVAEFSLAGFIISWMREAGQQAPQLWGRVLSTIRANPLLGVHTVNNADGDRLDAYYERHVNLYWLFRPSSKGSRGIDLILGGVYDPLHSNVAEWFDPDDNMSEAQLMKKTRLWKQPYNADLQRE